MLSTSPAGSVNTVDHYKAIRTAGIAIASVFIAADLAVDQAIQSHQISFGSYQILETLLSGAIAYAIDIIRRRREDNDKPSV